MGDLIGVLSSPEGPFAALNNHSPDGLVIKKTYIYDDSGEKDIIGAQHSAGPGSLHDFAGRMTTIGLTQRSSGGIFRMRAECSTRSSRL